MKVCAREGYYNDVSNRMQRINLPNNNYNVNWDNANMVADLVNQVINFGALEGLGGEDPANIEAVLRVLLNGEEINGVNAHPNVRDAPERIAPLPPLQEQQAQAAQAQAQQAQELQELQELAAVLNSIDARISDFVPAASSGIAAGDEETLTQKGLWIGGIYGISKQSASNTIIGYNSSISGVSIGFDLEKENDVIGIAYSNFNSDFDYNDKKGKTHANSHAASLYGVKQLTNNFRLNGIFLLVSSNITSEDVRGSNDIIAKGKYKSLGYNAEAILNYRIPLQSMSITPNIGFRYFQFKDKPYTEIGAGAYNVKFDPHHSSNKVGIVGVKWDARYNISENTQIIPAINFSVESYFNNNADEVKAKLVITDNYIVSEGKTIMPKIGYNIGANALVKNNNIALSMSYNLHLQKLYYSHQCAIKFRILF